MKKLFAIAVLVLVLVLVLQAVSFACIPPTDPADCSAGYWKNHTDWMSDSQWVDPSPEIMLAALEAKGNDPLRYMRADVVTWLNEAYPLTDCEED